MTTVKNISDWKVIRKNLSNTTLGFVPTMGALHAGHISLVQQARRECHPVVVSIFVNPTQFNDPTDIEHYPRDIPGDLKKLLEQGVDYVLIPNAEDIYADRYRYKVNENDLSYKLCGRDRPGHFDGVLTVVLKLFNIVAPTRAYFGEKDFQQLMLIRDMVKYFFLPIEIVALPIVRDCDGVALSSRNVLLNADEKKLAAVFAKLLKESDTAKKARAEMETVGISVDYVEEHFGRRLGAVRIGKVRLIDNIRMIQ